MSQLLIKPGSTVLFQGDSITDAGRLSDETFGLGYGYVNLACWLVTANYPEWKIKFVNRGIGGNRVCDLEARWTEDCIALQPDWVSIMIGINDTACCCTNNQPSDVPEFEAGYRRILDRVKSETNAGIVLLEPFVLPVPEDRKLWRDDLDSRIEAVRRVAKDYDAPLVHLDGIFASVSEKTGPEFWAQDGVHPTPQGHVLIAQEWIKAVGGYTVSTPSL